LEALVSRIPEIARKQISRETASAVARALLIYLNETAQAHKFNAQQIDFIV
jgi:hypothetical protein